jgi:K+/H+ antiporter YhaU regulatory subunit KhtT
MTILNSVQIENTDFVRDMKTHAVLNTDVAGLQRYKEQRKRTLSQKQEFQETKQRLESIETEMATLKKIVSELSVLKSRG